MCWIVIIVVVVIISALMVWASADIGSRVYLKSVCRYNTDERVVALTFDDGPHATMTPRVLDVLKRYDVPATFFLIGENVDRHPEIVKRIVSEGHIVGNHTYSHRGTFPLASVSDVRVELQRCYEAIQRAVGKSPKLFRPPFGVTNPMIGSAVKAKQLNSIGWSIRSLDTISSRSREEVCERIVKRLHPGAIILLHDRCDDADVLLQQLIPQIIDKGYRIVSLQKFIKEEIYEN